MPIPYTGYSFILTLLFSGLYYYNFNPWQYCRPVSSSNGAIVFFYHVYIIAGRPLKSSKYYLCEFYIIPVLTSSSLADTDSPMGSREASVGKSSKSSIDALSSEAGFSATGDMTISDGGISDTARVPSDIESTFNDSDLNLRGVNSSSSSQPLSTTPRSDPMKRIVHHQQDIVNGNHKTSTPSSTTSGKARSERMLAAPPSPWEHSRSPSPGDTSPTGSGREVRYFQVDSFYETQSHS